MASAPIPATAYLNLFVAGYPGAPGLELAVENVKTLEHLQLQVSPFPGETWKLYHFQLPDRWKTQNVRIIARDNATGHRGWLAFSTPVPDPGVLVSSHIALRLLGIVVCSFLVLGLPAVAACLIAISRRIRDPIDLVATSLLTQGLAGCLAFWIYFANRSAGIGLNVAILGSSLLVIALGFKKSTRSRFSFLRPLIVPGALWGLASVFIVSLGFLHGGLESPTELPSYRFGPPRLAADNVIPEIFADGILAGHVPSPIMADWLSSDRPPLQTGMVLFAYPLLPGDSGLHYQIFSVTLQCLFLAGLWMFLKAWKCSDRVIMLVVLVTLFSGFTFLNAFYTWPKLFPVAFLLVAMVYLRTDRFAQLRTRTWPGIAVGLSAAFALLCHGGSMFALLGMAALVLVGGRYPRFGWLAGMAVAGLLFYVPWIAYQHLYDPPGDRLIKWHIGGSSAVQPNVSFRQVLSEDYGKLSGKDILRIKGENFSYLMGDPKSIAENLRVVFRNIADNDSLARNEAAEWLRSEIFYRWIPCLGLAVMGPLFFLLPTRLCRHRDMVRAAASIWICNGLILVIWCLLMFGPATTYIHQGTYLTVILGLAGSCLIFWAFHPWIAGAFALLHVMLQVILFIWLTPTASPGIALTYGPINWPLGVACLVSGVACVVIVLQSSSWFPPPPEPVKTTGKKKSVR